MIIGILPEQGGSLSSYRATGQDGRLADYYLRPYGEAADTAYFFSYDTEVVDAIGKCRIVSNRWGMHRWLYAFLLPFVQWSKIKQCSILRIMQATGEVPALIAKVIFNIPIIATYGYHYDRSARHNGSRFRHLLFRLRTKIALRLFDKVIVTTPRLYEELKDNVPAARLALIPNGVDTLLFSPGEEVVSSAETTIVSVGALKKEKNFKLLIDAVSALNEKVSLTIIGDGPLREELMRYARQRNVDLKLPGTIPHKDVPGYLRKADIFMLTSFSEGHPKALLEAMSCACACIGTRVDGIKDIIRDKENGLLCDLDPASCERALQRCLRDPDFAKQLGYSACNEVKAHYDISTLVAGEIKLIEKVIASSLPRWWVRAQRRWYGRLKRLYGYHDLKHKVREHFLNKLWGCLTPHGRAVTALVRHRVHEVTAGRAIAFPDMLHIELTNRCNLRCAMCAHTSMQRVKQDMDLDLFKKVIDECVDYDIDAIALYYFGEALLYEPLLQAIHYVRDRLPRVHTRIRTNAQLLDNTCARQIIASGLTALEFSIDGYDKASYEMIMQGARYETVCANIDDYFRLKQVLGLAQQNLIVTIDMDSTRTTMNQFVRRWNRYAPVSVTALHQGYVTAGCLQQAKNAFQRTTACPEVLYHAMILSNGEMSFCCSDVEGALSIGNVCNDRLFDLWHNERACYLRRMHQEAVFDAECICRQCSCGILRQGVVRR